MTARRRASRGVRALLGVLAIGFAACDGESAEPTTTVVVTSVPGTVVTTAPGTPVPTATTTAAPATIASTTNVPGTAAHTTTTTTIAVTTSTAVATTEPCVAPTGTDTFEEGYPLRMSSLVGSDIRTGAHPCFERIVIEFAGRGELPGVRVGYVDDPVLLSPSDQTVEIAGDATLLVAIAAWMPSMEGDGYAGPSDIVPANVEHVLELRQVENFEGMHQWAVGLDRVRPFEVTFLDAPPRIVIDIATA